MAKSLVQRDSSYVGEDEFYVVYLKMHDGESDPYGYSAKGAFSDQRKSLIEDLDEEILMLAQNLLVLTKNRSLLMALPKKPSKKQLKKYLKELGVKKDRR